MQSECDIYHFSKYKTMVKQEPGINSEVITWMDKVWKNMAATPFERAGGLLCDEMTIQVVN